MRKRSGDMEEEAPAVHSVSLQLAKHGISILAAGTCVVERTSFANRTNSRSNMYDECRMYSVGHSSHLKQNLYLTFLACWLSS